MLDIFACRPVVSGRSPGFVPVQFSVFGVESSYPNDRTAVSAVDPLSLDGDP